MLNFLSINFFDPSSAGIQHFCTKFRVKMATSFFDWSASHACNFNCNLIISFYYYCAFTRNSFNALHLILPYNVKLPFSCRNTVPSSKPCLSYWCFFRSLTSYSILPGRNPSCDLLYFHLKLYAQGFHLAAVWIT